MILMLFYINTLFFCSNDNYALEPTSVINIEAFKQTACKWSAQALDLV